MYTSKGECVVIEMSEYVHLSDSEYHTTCCHNCAVVGESIYKNNLLLVQDLHGIKLGGFFVLDQHDTPKGPGT